ncbi:Uncharacterized protein Rs2_15673 [Raphanus sativus]|nr:Uncharacterized protein Rs2_15673 [Raphanus sativus]
MVFNVGKKLGAYEGQELTKTSARTRVLVNGLQPLIKETILEFGSGEEYKLTLEYERLENHCSYCSCLTHMSYECPEKQEKATQEVNNRLDYKQHSPDSPSLTMRPRAEGVRKQAQDLRKGARSQPPHELPKQGGQAR